MKKTLLSIAVAIASLSASAQTSDSEQSFKPIAGSVSTELNFNPFRGNLSLNNALNQIKFRYFAKSDLALRLGLHFSTIDTVANRGSSYGTQSTFSKDERKGTIFDVNLGVEKHFKGTSRLSPYIGADFTFGMRTASQDLVNNQVTYNIKNAWAETVYIGQPPYYTQQVVQLAYNRFGITAVAGFDFYLARNLFLGYEFNLSYLKTNYKLPEIKITGNGQPAQPPVDGKNESSAFGTSLMNGIRIGYTF
ncbi:outer membrane beta-barrel protein [Pedobacter deserti]|uniref:outer membrane beta-barrel protein n=1 Tax=Pedobacter deserti TaxID=2817382 RepID=UPI00210C870E|nr:outer membrane beta-barrel protein [Pedobacter sp. SYSU D00382]